LHHLVKRADHRRGRGQAVARAVEGCLGDRHRQLANRVAAHHIAKIDQAADRPLTRLAPLDQRVVARDIAVDHAFAQARQQRHRDGFVARKQGLDQRAAFRIGHIAEKCTNRIGRMLQIPLARLVAAGMAEIGQVIH